VEGFSANFAGTAFLEIRLKGLLRSSCVPHPDHDAVRCVIYRRPTPARGGIRPDLPPDTALSKRFGGFPNFLTCCRFRDPPNDYLV
jgi:hypothetical protein